MDQELAWALDRWRDGELDAAGRAALALRLRTDARCRAALVAELRLAGELAGLLRQPSAALWQRIDDALAIAGDGRLAERVLRRLPAPVRARRWRWALAAALLLGVLGVLGVVAAELAGRAHPAAIAVAVMDERGSPVQAARISTAMPLACDNDHQAHFALVDGSQVEVGSGSAVALALAGQDHGGARLELSSGSLQVVVAKQSGGAHFVVQTREAILTALGTRFTALRFPWGTRLEVSEGRVLAHQLADGAEAEVPAGMRVDMHKRVGGPLLPAPLVRPLPAGAIEREPVADAIVVAGRYAHENRGGCLSHILTSPDAPPDEQREFFLRFDLAGVRRPVAAAHLALHLNQLTHAGMRLEVAVVADSRWREMAITWATRPEAGPVVAEWRPGPDDLPIDLTAAVNAAGDLLSLRIRAVAGTPRHAVVGFSTREALPHKRPRLVLEPVRLAP